MHIQEIGENILMAFDTLRTHKVRSALTMLGVIGVSPSMIVGSFGPGGTQPVVKYQGTEANRPIIFGVSANYDVVRNVYIDQGRFFSMAEEQHRAQVAVIGYAIAETLFGSNDPIGKEIDVDGKVVQVTELMRRRRGVGNKEPNNFGISTPGSIFEVIAQFAAVASYIVFPLSAAGLLVGGIGVMNIMLVSVTERTKEIGVRRAIGARKADIIWQFLTEAITLTAVGGLIGIFIGWVVSLGLHRLPPTLPSVIPLWAVLLGFFVSCSIGLIFGIWPAMKAARLDPIEALRYE